MVGEWREEKRAVIDELDLPVMKKNGPETAEKVYEGIHKCNGDCKPTSWCTYNSEHIIWNEIKTATLNQILTSSQGNFWQL